MRECEISKLKLRSFVLSDRVDKSHLLSRKTSFEGESEEFILGKGKARMLVSQVGLWIYYSGPQT